MDQSPSSNRAISRFMEVEAPPDITPLPTDYLNVSTTSIEQALEPLSSYLSNLQGYLAVAEMETEDRYGHNLSRDEAVALYLYTTQWQNGNQSLYAILNRDLRTKDPANLRKWRPYMKILMSALNKLRSQRVTVYRGLRNDVSRYYTRGKIFVWGSPTSCSRDLITALNFLDSNGSGTLFRIRARQGKDISGFSAFESEREVLLPPGTKFRVIRETTVETIEGYEVPVVDLEEII